ncbi:MAG: hypothetical protein ACTH4K_08655 [Serratia bockelmannii]
MADILWVGLIARCERLSPYGRMIEQGALVVTLCLLLVWGGMLGAALCRCPQPWRQLQNWCRQWVMPLLFIGVGLVLIGNGSHSGVGRWLDAADMWIVRFVMDARGAPEPARPTPPTSSLADQPVSGGAVLHCPGTYAGLEVQGCRQ